MVPLVLLLLGLVLVVLVVPYRWTPVRVQRKLDKLPGPRAYPLIGNSFWFNVPLEGILGVYFTLVKTYGPVTRLWLMGSPYVFVTDLDVIEAVLSDRHNLEKAPVMSLLKPWLGDGLLLSSGEHWTRHRRMLAPTFHLPILASYMGVFNKSSRTLVHKLRQVTSQPWIVLDQHLSLWALDTICETAMGISVHAQSGGGVEYSDAVHKMSELYTRRYLSFWLYNDLAFWLNPASREQARTLKTLRSFTDKGHDTISSTLVWVLYVLGRHLEEQEKVMQELEEVFCGVKRDVTMEDLRRLKYMEQVICETLRLFPPVPALARQLATDLQVKNYCLPAGAIVIILAIVNHRNPDIFPDPDKFNPDNFHPDAIRGRPRYAYIPFSAGPRNCIGHRFAMIKMKVVLSHLLRNFKIKSLDKLEDIKLTVGILMNSKEGLRMKLSQRN